MCNLLLHAGVVDAEKGNLDQFLTNRLGSGPSLLKAHGISRGILVYPGDFCDVFPINTTFACERYIFWPIRTITLITK